MSSVFRRFAALVAATATVAAAMIGMAHGVAGAETGVTPPGSTPTTTYIGPVVPVPCERHVEIGNRAVYEGTRASTTDSLYTYLTFSVTSSGCLRDGVVEWMTLGGTASPGYDYVGASGTVRFAQSDATPRSITIRVLKDGSPGPNETLYVVLTNPTAGLDLDDPVGMGTIVNDDDQCSAPPDISPDPDYHCSE